MVGSERVSRCAVQLAAAQSDKDKNYYEAKCASLDRQIDRLVYDLYGLTDEEIAISGGGGGEVIANCELRIAGPSNNAMEGRKNGERYYANKLPAPNAWICASMIHRWPPLLR